MDKIKLPEGWKAEAIQPKGHYLLTAPRPERYMVTIDFNRRGWRSGMSSIGRLQNEDGISKSSYEGRGWKQRLVDDACAWLALVTK